MLEPKKFTNQVAKSEYESLNEAQRKAVDTIEGPVMVIAGPGTGKTKLLASRVENILQNGYDIDPENILCITYTNAGRKAMRDKLAQFSPEMSERVPIHTFHSFAQKVIRDNPQLFPGMDFDLISDYEHHKLIQEIISELPINSPIYGSIKNPFFYSSILSNFILNVLKNHVDTKGLTQALQNQIQALENEIEELGKLPKTITKINTLKASIKKNQKTLACIPLVDKFLSKLNQIQRLTYDRLIEAVVEGFQKDRDLLRNYCEQYQYILVDEFQDTNKPQLEIVRLLLDDSDNRNILVVGDDDQSIYSFQGASVFNIFQFYQSYIADLPPKEIQDRIIVLSENYRSVQSILDVAKATIANNHTRIVTQIKEVQIHKDIRSAHPTYLKNDFEAKLVKLNGYQDEASQYLHLAKEINNEVYIQKRFKYKDIAILYAKHTEGSEITKYFDFLDIPYRWSSKRNALTHPFISDFIQLITYIYYEKINPFSRDNILFDLLYKPWSGLDAVKASSFLSHFRKFEFENEKTSIRQFAQISQSDVNFPEIINFFQKINVALSCSSFHILKFIDEIFEIFELKTFLMHLEKSLDYAEAYNAFRDFLKTNIEKEHIRDFKSCLDFIQFHEENELGVEYIVATEDIDAVTLTTIHSSKGLEYPKVYVINAEKIEKSNKNNKEIYIPEDFLVSNETLSDIEKQILQTNEIEEKRRLFFVAVTRAMQELTIAFVVSKKEKEKPSDIISAILNLKEIEVQYPLLTLEDQNQLPLVYSLKNKAKSLANLNANILIQKIEQFKLSHSSMTNFLTCPQHFFFDNILSLSGFSNNFNLNYGSLLHKIVEFFYKQAKEFKSIPSFESFLEYGKKTLQGLAFLFSESSLKELEKNLSAQLQIIYNDYLAQSFIEDIEIEKEIEVNFQGVPIKGKIDKIEIYPDKIRIIDFKTGDLTDKRYNYKFWTYMEADTVDYFDDKYIDSLYSGAYYRQAMFYQLLCSIAYPNKTIEVEFQSLLVKEEQLKGKIQVNIVAQDFEQFKELIKSTYSQIKKLEFPTCNRKECPTCQKMITV
ncbi:MAG: ATP-dependent helicase [Chitinophagales bacterium]|nr:ATP-dependent helicase [Chitinophagales bacterium]